MHKINCILLVDDDPIGNFITKGVLSRAGIAESIMHVENAPDALAYVRDFSIKENMCPEMIITDINMPGMDGFELARQIMSSDFKNKDRVVLVALTATDRIHPKFIKDEMFPAFREILQKPLKADVVKRLYDQYFIV